MNPSPAPVKRLRWLPYALGFGLIIALGFGLRPKPAPVETARAATGPLSATVSEVGKTRIKQRYVVSSPVTGQLRRVPFKPGATIAAGDVVAVIEPMAASPLDTRSRALAEARRDSAVAALEKTRAAHALAISELKRVERMFAAGTVSPQDFDAAQLRETAAAREIIATAGALRAAETGTFNTDPLSQTMTRASTRKLSPSVGRSATGVMMSATTLTRCSSTPRAEILVKAAGSTSRTRASSGCGPPHCSSSTRAPGVSAAPSRDSSSMTTSRSAGSPTSSSGVPAVTGRSLS